MNSRLTEAEFESIFLEFYERLYYYVLHNIQRSEVSRDIVSECFSEVWKNRGKVKKEKTVAYLFTCARNKSITYMSRSRLSTNIDQSSPGLFTDDTDEKWEDREMRYCRVEQVMKTLSPRTRFVLRKCYMEHCTYKQVAQMLGISTSGVKKHIVKGMSILRVKVNAAASV